MTNSDPPVYKRCGCTDPITQRQLGSHCPLLTDPNHGTWYYAIQVPTVGGRHARQRRGGYPTRAAALIARQTTVDIPAQQACAQAWTVTRWLRFWLQTVESQLRPSTLHGYHDHIHRYLSPTLGRLTLHELTARRIQTGFDLLARHRTRQGHPIAAATLDRIRATLRSALNAAVREGVIETNPIRAVRIAKPVRPHPVIWTDERVAAWHRGAGRPTVAVWTVPQLVTFLNGVRDDRLAALWWLVALRGLRRGELAGLHRSDLDIDAKELTVHSQVLALPGELHHGPPKSRASNRTIALDSTCVTRLIVQNQRQDQERRQPSQHRHDSRRHTSAQPADNEALFAYADGRPIRRPGQVIGRLRGMCRS
jgi:integrase